MIRKHEGWKNDKEDDQTTGHPRTRMPEGRREGGRKIMVRPRLVRLAESRKPIAVEEATAHHRITRWRQIGPSEKPLHNIINEKARAAESKRCQLEAHS